MRLEQFQEKYCVVWRFKEKRKKSVEWHLVTTCFLPVPIDILHIKNIEKELLLVCFAWICMLDTVWIIRICNFPLHTVQLIMKDLSMLPCNSWEMRLKLFIIIFFQKAFYAEAKRPHSTVVVINAIYKYITKKALFSLRWLYVLIQNRHAFSY